MPQRQDPATLAALDLGSNSFHMVVVHPEAGRFKVVDRMREIIRLAAGLDPQQRITPEASERALRCLERFGQRIRHLPRDAVRAVGTNAFRMARNSERFLRSAEQALGHSIDVVSGYEEARLIYLGVSHGLGDDANLRLVVDIGGGSTELIVGRRFEPQVMQSLHVGCVSLSQTFFSDGVIDARRMRAAVIAARQEFEPVEAEIAATGWEVAVGTSGTLLAINRLLSAQGWAEDGITLAALRRLQAAIIAAGHVQRLGDLGVSTDRALVLPGGLAIALGLFEELGISRLRVSDSALREGLLYDLLGRINDEDVREQTVRSLMLRFGVERVQAARIAVTCAQFLAQVGPDWLPADGESAKLLAWAAALHEIGHTISHSQYQKHGAYLLHHLDMPGFSRGEQTRLANLVRGHRRKLPTAELGGGAEAQHQLRFALLLRLAVVLHRARGVVAPPVTLKAADHVLRLAFPRGWLAAHALTTADLAQEADYLLGAGYKLKFK
ncbi:MAG: Ppx/GppA family phosphatase [Gammaproteobacteria bacterium]|nr:Ppx/GppA family phosphatase [Gammaproteobacteria bacterium]